MTAVRDDGLTLEEGVVADSREQSLAKVDPVDELVDLLRVLPVEPRSVGR